MFILFFVVLQNRCVVTNFKFTGNVRDVIVHVSSCGSANVVVSVYTYVCVAAYAYVNVFAYVSEYVYIYVYVSVSFYVSAYLNCLRS